ncbi:DUF6894 family protein [Mesorhizobium sp. IMUNJ 23232]|uniref:DUF6894 family protein n=1 Tax=Mesorhizobium sp. IMUNJ 23232 TaxID=3376064 RepID=UPI0037888A81
MPKFHFDVTRDGVTHLDRFGIEYVNPDAAVREAVRKLTKLLEEAPVESAFAVAVRDDTDDIIYRGEAHFEDGWQVTMGWTAHPSSSHSSSPA